MKTFTNTPIQVDVSKHASLAGQLAVAAAVLVAAGRDREAAVDGALALYTDVYNKLQPVSSAPPKTE